MSILDTFERTIQAFLGTDVLEALAEVAIDTLGGDDTGVLIEKFRERLKLPIATSGLKPNVGVVRKRSPKKTSSPKPDQQWLTYEEYNKRIDDEYICGYVQTRGKYKDHYCGIVLDETTTVTWNKNDGFVASTPEQELEEVSGKRYEMRCSQCWSRDPKSGEQKRKKGRGEKLISEHQGEIVAPTVIPGVSLPEDAGLMGFLNGNKSIFQSPMRAMDPPKKKTIRAKRYPGLERTEEYSHVIPNPEHHYMAWLIRTDSEGQTVLGKFARQPTPSKRFEDGYMDDLLPLSESEIEQCKEYNLEYKQHVVSSTEDEDDGIPVVHDQEEDTNTIQDMPDIPTLDIDDLLN